MLFVSYTFLFFLPLVIVVRWMLPERWTVGWLLLASYVFYLSWGPIYGLLLGGSTLFTFLLGLAIERWPERKGSLLALGVTGCLGTLGYFKYAGFLATQAWNVARLLGHRGELPALDIVLPLGISFYLFQALSYLVDVYRGGEAERSPWRYALYISFFPQLVAGPIVRSAELIPQLKARAGFDGARFSQGAFIALRGLIKKAVLADNLARWSDHSFAHFQSSSTLGLWLGVLAYAGQIYCDFSGYTDIARGSAMMLGYDLPENFDLPYLAKSPADFWRRWHMTLSRWLRDYLYIPLGGNRRGQGRTYLNLMLTMALGGLWHGAHWRFLVWGVYHGALLALHRAWSTLSGSRLDQVKASAPYRVAAILATLFAVTIGWVFFRAESLEDALRIIELLFQYRPHQGTPDAMQTAYRMLAALAFGHLLGASRVIERSYDGLPAAARGVTWAAMIVVVYLFASATDVFIYFQF